MGTTNLKKFKLNNSVLKDFDALMSMHLDKVEELTVSEIDADSKLLNIIGLCINIKTLIIEGDQRINTNNVIKLYRVSLFANLITVSILLVLREDIVNYIYVFALLQSFAISLYHATYENITCNINNNNDYKKYFSIDSLLANLISIIAPLCLGILIETYSYLVAFVVLFIITMLCFIYSLFLNNEK